MALKSLKPHIGIFGRRNVGKSSFINAISDQEVAIVSEEAGTTTDPVKKTIELDQIGPVIIVDTAGIDDQGKVGELRIKASMKVLEQIDLAVFLVTEFSSFEKKLVELFESKSIPYLLIHNKVDLAPGQVLEGALPFSCMTREGKENIIAAITNSIPQTAYQNPSLMGDLVTEGDVVLLVTPVDTEAPAGRMILPQMQALRDALDNGCIAMVTKESDLGPCLSRLKESPALVITDSQAFVAVDSSLDSSIKLTSFSILFARMKADFEAMIEGTKTISSLRDNDSVLILESCSHHSTDDDIGRVKIPRWINQFTGKKIHYDVVAGLNDPPQDLEDYAMVIQCGGCMLTRQQVLSRIKPAMKKNIPVSNYGMVIAYTQGIFERVLSPFNK